LFEVETQKNPVIIQSGVPTARGRSFSPVIVVRQEQAMYIHVRQAPCCDVSMDI